MLILTRRTGESIRIGDDITVTVIEVSRDQLRVGIDAPRHIAVHRQEVYESIQRENEAARSSGVADVTPNRGDAPRAAVSAAAMPRRPRRDG